MVKVYYSHMGEDELKITDEYEEYNFNGKFLELIDEINSKHPGFKNLIFDRNNKLLSSARAYNHVKIDDKRILDQDDTRILKENDEISNDNTLLISIYNPKKFAKLFEESLIDPKIDLKYMKGIEPAKIDFKQFLGDIEGPIEEKIWKFQNGDSTLKNLMVPQGESINLIIKDRNQFDKNNSKLIHEPLIKAIKKIWELDNIESKLYLHQEDCLFYIMGKLKNPEKIPGEALLLAIPTGGGKTEAFLIPIISYIYEKKVSMDEGLIKPKISSIITYPTKALANDQASRIIEILYELNYNSKPNKKVTIGILTGDTPTKSWDLKKKNIVQTCPNCGSSNFDFLQKDSKNNERYYIHCKHCEEELDFIILTREDILNHPPDILITNLDMVNYCLQSPRMRTLFKPDNLDLDLMVFDEIHLCESVFGCHTGHLLRRLEATCGKKPLYIGVSATIGNAKELASLIFNVKKDNVLYLNEKNRPYLKDEIDHYRYHYVLTPSKWNDRYGQVVTTTLNVVDVLGHSIRDPHFRKTIVFSNYRQDTDNLVKYLRDQEDRYFSTYKNEIQHKLKLKESLNQPEKEIAEFVGGWYELLESEMVLYDQKIEIGWHRGGLEQKERLRAVTRFSTSKKINYEWFEEFPVDIMMATNTLELGIDIGDVSNVFNCSAPFTVNEYVQRAGRGGRKSDSTTFTIIDPTNPLDFYLKKNFKDYVIPENREFEDAPIIITNESIRDVHIYARILEFIADELLDGSDYKHDIKVEDLAKLQYNYKGELVEFMQDPEIFGEIIFDKMFKNRTIIDVNNKQKNALALFNDWFAIEHELLDVKMVNIDSDLIKNKLISKCRNLRDKISSDKISPYDYLSGMKTIENSLVPRMRGSGPVCSIKLIKDQQEVIKDHVNRRRAMTNMPPGGFATQGANTFRIDDLERDPDTEREVTHLLRNNNASNFFKKYFGDNFPSDVDDIDLRTPKNLKVRYFPYRFYCPDCGKTFIKLEDERCECFSEIRQLTEIYLCDTCGEIYAPPIPRVCLNPSHLEDKPDFMRGLNRPRPKPDYSLFKFNALPKLNWQCQDCKAIFNFNQSWKIEIPALRSKGFENLSFENPLDVAKHYQYRPESTARNKEKYLSYGYNLTRYSCERCGKYSIQAKNVPTVRCNTLEYLNNNNDIMERENLDIGYIEFKYVDVISLSREYVRKFYTKDTMEIKTSEMFPGYHRSFLANAYKTHVAYLNINSNLIDEFIDTQKECLNGSCEDCTFIDKIQDNKITRPSLDLKDWEKDKTPDIRLKWCDKIENKECENEFCSNCGDFDRRNHLKYLLLHALKHALILAMPKYMGINKNEIRGNIYPNGEDDPDKPELAFLDVHEDGSGSIYLMKRNWDKIWELSEELMKNALEGKGTLLLPQFCERHNIDLCPIIGLNFYHYIHESELNDRI